MAGSDDILDQLFQRLAHEFQKVEKEINARQKDIKHQLKQVSRMREAVMAEKRQLHDESRALEMQQAEMEENVAELSALRSEMNGSTAGGGGGATPPKKGGWCCCGKSDKNGELDVTGALTVARVDALQAIRLYGAGSADVNGVYQKVTEGGETFFEKADGKAVQYRYQEEFGTPNGWYVADSVQGGAMYMNLHEDETTLPFAGFQVITDECVTMGGIPGDPPAPKIEPQDC
mmetsp:Transcript_63482/g.184012  ORF Transcript_63482/g.184012 Transcript_63482/m.184012 type:complete len:232 (-) Transcript_63482:166-861(-)